MEKAFHGLADRGERKKGAEVAPEEGSSPGREGGGWSVVPAGHCPQVPTSLRVRSRPRASAKAPRGSGWWLGALGGRATVPDAEGG